MEESSRKSATSAVERAFVRSFIHVPAGLLAGLLTKSKGIHVVAIQFKDGMKSLIEINDKILFVFNEKNVLRRETKN